MLGFLIALGAGYLTPQLEDNAAAPVMNAVSKHVPVAPHEKRLVAFMLALVAAAILATIFDSGSILTVSAGVVLGYFGKRIVAAIQKLLDDRKNA